MADYISEVAYKGGNAGDFIEIAVPSGADMSGYTIVVYAKIGTVETTYGLGTVQSTTAGKDAYLADAYTPGFIGLSSKESIALVDDLGNVVQFISFENEAVTATSGPATGLSPTDIGTLNFATDSFETSDRGVTYAIQSTPTPGTIPCFRAGNANCDA